MLAYFTLLMNSFEIEYFLGKMGSGLKEVLMLENSVLNGVPFWETESSSQNVGNDDMMFDGGDNSFS
jgi:hypothetical protein